MIHGQFLVQMFQGHFDDAYIEKLQKLASGHQVIGSTPRVGNAGNF